MLNALNQVNPNAATPQANVIPQTNTNSPQQIQTPVIAQQAPVPQAPVQPATQVAQNPTPVANIPPAAQNEGVVSEAANQLSKHASFGKRFVATIIDSLILYIATIPVNLIFQSTEAGSVISTQSTTADVTSILSFMSITFFISILISSTYYIFLTGLRGQTLGKMVMKIKVVNLESNEVPGLLKAAHREALGKSISMIVFGIGYLSMLRDKDKRTWHDKISGTVVYDISE